MNPVRFVEGARYTGMSCNPSRHRQVMNKNDTNINYMLPKLHILNHTSSLITIATMIIMTFILITTESLILANVFLFKNISIKSRALYRHVNYPLGPCCALYGIILL